MESDSLTQKEGLLAIRYQRAKNSEKPSLTVVKFDQL
jgi:hypothetical protein